MNWKGWNELKWMYSGNGVYYASSLIDLEIKITRRTVTKIHYVEFPFVVYLTKVSAAHIMEPRMVEWCE
jgi:hypothetical protein